MRLIDADALKDKFKAHYDLFVGDYKGEHMSVADKSRVDEILNSMAEVINAPTIFDTDNATNGEVIQKLFKPTHIEKTDDNIIVEKYDFNKDWWNSLYKR